MDIHGRLAQLDFIVIAVYVALLIGIGMWVSFKRRGAQDLFLAGRSLGWSNVGLSIFGTNISPSFLIAACGAAYATGMVTANFEWLAWWFLLLLGMLFAPYYLGTKVSTMPQFIRRRFGKKAHAFLSWYALFTTIILWLGGTLYAGGKLLGQIMNWPLWVSVLVLTLIATSFTVAGGLAAVVVTDAFQSVLMILGAAALTILAFLRVGSLDALLENVPPDYWNLVQPADDPDYPWHAMFLGYPVLGIWFWCTDQTIVQRVLGARDLRQGQLGTVFAGFLKILPPFIFMLPGIFCYVLHPDLKDSDEAFLTMVTTILPAGMVGLIVAVLIAAVISTLDSGLNSFSTLFTLDIYVKKFRKIATSKEIKWIGRLSTMAAAAIAFVCACSMGGAGKNMFDLLQGIIAFIAPPMAAVFLIGVLWKRATGAAAVATLFAGSALSLGVGVCYFKKWPDETFWPHYLLLSFYLFAGICVFMVGVSLLTRHGGDEESLPSLKAYCAGKGAGTRTVWSLWAVLALAMLALYLIFD
jgi:SSS family solute:Na+ symporter